MVDHTIVHFEIPADDVEKLREFYGQLFGWKIEKMPGPVEYWGIQTVPVDERMHAWVPPHPFFGFSMLFPAD